jgi:hypothetical protein
MTVAGTVAAKATVPMAAKLERMAEPFVLSGGSEGIHGRCRGVQCPGPTVWSPQPGDGVGRNEDALLRERKCHDLVVSAARETERPDVAGVVTFSQICSWSASSISLIERHHPLVHVGRSEAQGLPNVILVELWVLLKDGLNRSAGRDHSHEHGHRDARPSDTGETAHDLVVDLDASEGHGPIIRRG